MRSQEVSVKRDPELVRVFRRAVLPLMLTAVSMALAPGARKMPITAAGRPFETPTAA